MAEAYTLPTPNLEPPVGVSLGNAYVRWAEEVLFDGLSISLAAGRWTCLLGPSGVGKSMLLRLILGLSADEVGISGEIECSDGATLSGRVSYMAQHDLLLPWLSVLENVCIGSRLRGEHQNHDGARAHLQAVGLGGSADAMPATLSGGMRQRVALARTLMEDCPVVLMDEPFSALDAITRVRLQDMAAETLKGRTVLLVTLSSDVPRHVDDEEVLGLQGELLGRLTEAME